MAAENEPEVIRQQMDETRNALTDKIATLEQQVVETVQGATDGVKETVGALKDAVADTVQTVRDTVGDTVQTVRDTVGDTVTSVQETFSIAKQVENRPWTVLAISAGVGFAAGYLVTPPARRGSHGHMPWLSSHDMETSHQHHASPMAAVSGYETLSSSQSSAAPSTSSNGHERGEDWAQEPAASSSSTASHRPGMLDAVAHAFEGEITALKGLAGSAPGGLVRAFLVPQIPPAIKDKVEEIINDFTKKLGGEPVEGRLFGGGDESHEEHHEEGSGSE